MPELIECIQGSGDWHQLRLGIPTASNFDKIITPTGKPSGSADKYMNVLLGEWMLGAPVVDLDGLHYVDRGKDLEPEAVEYFEFTSDVKTKPGGIIRRDDGMVSCSPDRLIDDDGGLEIKAPALQTHIGYLRAGGPQYKHQIQGSLWISEFDKWTFLSYFPGLPPLLLEVGRDEDYIKKMAELVDNFVDKLLEERQKLEALKQ